MFFSKKITSAAGVWTLMCFYHRCLIKNRKMFKCRATTPEAWHQFSQYNKDRAEAEMQASVTLREAIDATLAQTKNELEAQRVATEFAYRKRIHEFEQAEKELMWQEKNVRSKICAEFTIFCKFISRLCCVWRHQWRIRKITLINLTRSSVTSHPVVNVRLPFLNIRSKQLHATVKTVSRGWFTFVLLWLLTSWLVKYSRIEIYLLKVLSSVRIDGSRSFNLMITWACK